MAAVGHRVVHGGQHRQASAVDDALLDDLRKISSYDPDHLPGEIELIRIFREHDPQLPQIACFDTAFHSTLPRVARQLPIGTAYAVWTGIGVFGTAVLGMYLFGESMAPLRLLCLALIITGIIGLKLTAA